MDDYGDHTFQSYQFRQINPDASTGCTVKRLSVEFQSYQFRQINPDFWSNTRYKFLYHCFNRINSGRSIPTIQSKLGLPAKAFVSIVSIQADQSRPLCLGFAVMVIVDVSIVSIQADQSRLEDRKRLNWLLVKSFNRINSGRSIPTCERTQKQQI